MYDVHACMFLFSFSFSFSLPFTITITCTITITLHITILHVCLLVFTRVLHVHVVEHDPRDYAQNVHAASSHNS